MAQRNLGYWRVRLPTLAPWESSGLAQAIRQGLKYGDLRSSVLDLMAAAIDAQMGLGEELEWLRRRQEFL